MFFTDDEGYQSLLVFTPMLSSLILGSNKRITNWISTRISSEKIKPFGTNLEPTMSNSTNTRVTLKFSNSGLVKKGFVSLKSNFILNLYIVYVLKNWLLNQSNNFPLKNCLFAWQSNWQETQSKVDLPIMVEE